MTTPLWPSLGSHRLRKGRCSLPGQIYLVTFTTARRAHVFREFALACSVSKAVCESISSPHARLLAWVLMPDHWHGLVELGDHEPLGRVVARAKSAATRVAYREPLWEAGFHDHALRRQESVLHCARYIALNPVRAGLVRRCGDYPFWDAIWL